MDNVVNLFSRSQSKTSAGTLNAVLATPVAETEPPKVTPEKTNFSTIAERNAALRDKLKREREEANKSVLKSYRIK